MYLFKNRIHEYFNINSFKDEESDKMSADSAYAQGASGHESTDSPVAHGSQSLTFDAEYVFCFSSIITIIINDYFLIISSIVRFQTNFFFYL